MPLAASLFHIPRRAARSADGSSRRSGWFEADDVDARLPEARFDGRDGGEIEDAMTARGEADGAFDGDFRQATVDRGVI